MQTSHSPLISPDQAIRKVGESGIVIVDARGGVDAKQRYLAGHIAGAVMVSLETDLSEIGDDAARGGRHPLPDPKVFGITLAKVGITPSTEVLVYDDRGGANAAARFWWMMRAAGHQKVQVVDGGLAAMLEAGISLSKDSPPAQKEGAPYPFSTWQLPLADLSDVDYLRSRKEAVVIDVREAYRYCGESEPIDLVAGHIPGAINIPYLNNLEATGKFRSPGELAEMYGASIGNKASSDVVVHCGSGVTACHTLLALDAAGLPLPRLYIGSWSEWSRNDKPIATGDAR